MNIAMILAGGRGTRVGADVPKQFIEVLGRPVLSYTIERFQNHPEVDAIEVVCRKGYEDELRAICDAGPFVSDEVISDAIRVCRLHGNASPAHSQVYLAATPGDGEGTSGFVDRDEVMCLNSPQALRYGYAKWVYEEGARRGLLDKVEPHTTSLMFAMGERVWFSKGSTANIKITTAEDLRLFKGWVLAGK